jgi:hypothetical protein
VVDGLISPGKPISEIHHGEFFDALVLIHHGHPAEAVSMLSAAPEDFRDSHSGLWRPWYAALWAEATVLAGDAAAADRISRARQCSRDNPIALAIVDRSAALVSGDRNAMLAAAEQLRVAGCRYQWARTLVLAGGRDRSRGETELAAMGAAPMPLDLPEQFSQ